MVGLRVVGCGHRELDLANRKYIVKPHRLFIRCPCNVLTNLDGSPLCCSCSARCLSRKNEINFSIHTLTGKQHTIRAFPSETVLDVKKKVQDTQGIPCEQQRIIYVGQQPSDDQTLRDCNIRNGSVAHLVLSLRKPVILLYPPVPVDTTVAVELSPLWSFSALYPKLQPRNLEQPAADHEVSLGTTYRKKRVEGNIGHPRRPLERHQNVLLIFVAGPVPF